MTVTLPEHLTLDRVPTPIGEALVVTDQDDVLRAFNWRDYEATMLKWLVRRYPRTRLGEGRGPLRSTVEAYFGGDLGALGVVKWRGAGTDFQQTVWKALCHIPVGTTLSYAALASRIGRPTAFRAVGLANGSNPVSLVVPCHRVVGSDGSLTGYGGGIERKRWLLVHEGAHE